MSSLSNDNIFQSVVVFLLLVIIYKLYFSDEHFRGRYGAYNGPQWKKNK